MTFGIYTDLTDGWEKEFAVPNLLSLQMLVMKLNGQWPIEYAKYLPAKLSFLSKPLVVLYCIFWSFMAFHISAFFFIACYVKLNSDDSTIPEISAAFTQGVVFGFAFYTTVHFQRHHKELAMMFNFVFQNFRLRSARGLSYVTVEPCHRLAILFTYIWTLSCFGAVFYYILLPVFLQIWELPLDCWYPFKYYHHPVFELLYFSQLIGQIEVAIAFATSDVILVSMVLLIYAQYDVLFCSLKNIRYTALLINDAAKNLDELKKLQRQLNFEDEEVSQYFYSFEQKDDLNDSEGIAEYLEKLKLNYVKKNVNSRAGDFLMDYNVELEVALQDCITQHQNLIKICDMLERLYNPIVLVKSIQITLQLCNLAFVSTKANARYPYLPIVKRFYTLTPFAFLFQAQSSLLQNINNVIYLFMTLSDLLIYGYAGNWIKEQSIRVGDALLRSPWYLTSGSFRRSISIILANTMRPLQLTGGNFFILDYTKVIAVVKASFSFYTILQKLE